MVSTVTGDIDHCFYLYFLFLASFRPIPGHIVVSAIVSRRDVFDFQMISLNHNIFPKR